MGPPSFSKGGKEMLEQVTIVDEDRYTAEQRIGLSFLAGKPLTPREKEVWLLMAAGRSDAEIAEWLALNCLTVRFHLSNVLLKLGAISRQEAVVLAQRSLKANGGRPGNGSPRR
jgi:DNA-binding CsgD family transcriptional regulator